jgi:hypothetical protein
MRGCAGMQRCIAKLEAVQATRPMKKALLCFAFFFCVSSIIGYLAGSKMRSAAVPIKVDIASRIRLVDNGKETSLILEGKGG